MFHPHFEFFVVSLNGEYLTANEMGCPDGQTHADLQVACQFPSIYAAEQSAREFGGEPVRYYCTPVPWRKVPGKNYPDRCPVCLGTDHEPGTCTGSN